MWADSVAGKAFLSGAILLEIVATSLLPVTGGFTELLWTLRVLGGYVGSFFMLTLALRTIPLGIAYALWSGIGTATIAALGAVLFDEHLTVHRILGLASIIAGVTLLHLSTATSTAANPVPAQEQ